MKKSKILLLSALFIGALAFVSCGNAGDKNKEKECEKTECDHVKTDSTECEHATTEEAAVTEEATVEAETEAVEEQAPKDEKQIENLPKKKAEPNEKEKVKR